jgi:hypothetical protein
MSDDIGYMRVAFRTRLPELSGQQSPLSFVPYGSFSSSKGVCPGSLQTCLDLALLGPLPFDWLAFLRLAIYLLSTRTGRLLSIISAMRSV